MLIPYSVNTLTIRSPWANLSIFALNIVCFGLLLGGALPDEWLEKLVLSDWSPLSFISYQFLHAGFDHIIGNMIFLWVFGNALNGVMHDHDYIFAYLGCGIFAGILHLLVDGSPVVGASGAISGLLGMYLAVYPKNEITCFYWFFRPGSFELKGYILIIGWFLWDIFSAIRGEPGIASWAHVGGTIAGFGIGIALLKLQRIHLGDYDHPTILEILSRERSE